MPHYTTKQRSQALRMIEEGRTIAEIRGTLDAEAGRDNSTSVVGLPYEAYDYFSGVARGLQSVERRAASGLR